MSRAAAGPSVRYWKARTQAPEMKLREAAMRTASSVLAAVPMSATTEAAPAVGRLAELHRSAVRRPVTMAFPAARLDFRAGVDLSELQRRDGALPGSRGSAPPPWSDAR